MISLQETVNKTEQQLKAIKQSMEAKNAYHPEDASIYEGLSRADAYEVAQTLHAVPLREILIKSGTTGVGGAAYLIAPKIHDDLIAYSKPTDITSLIGRVVTRWKGNGDLTVNVMEDTTYRPTIGASGGKQAVGQGNYKSVTITPVEFHLDLAIANDMLEDNAYDLVDWHVQKAALGMGDLSSELALTVLKTATDGWGTKNGDASGDANETKWTGATTTDIEDLLAAEADDRWLPNTVIITPEAWQHSVQTTYITLANNMPLPTQLPTPTQGFHATLGLPPLDTLFSNNRALHAWATDTDTGGMTDCVTIVFDRNNALITGRKRWMEIKNYANPYQDLEGAVISARQDSATLYNDAIAVITET